LCKDNDVDTALRFFADMEVRGLQPDVFTYNVLLSALSEAGRSVEAQKMLHKLNESGKLYGRFFYPSIKSSVEAVETGKDPEVKSDIESVGNTQGDDQESYNKYIKELCIGGQLKEAKAVLDEMMQKGMSVDNSTYITLMEGLIKRQKRQTHAAG
jgi:pentatricopeptide repeat protein